MGGDGVVLDFVFEVTDKRSSKRLTTTRRPMWTTAPSIRWSPQQEAFMEAYEAAAVLDDGSDPGAD
ncbi:MAG: hypothetical protein ACLVDB_10035 [Anaeromassilibacillus sp.]